MIILLCKDVLICLDIVIKPSAICEEGHTSCWFVEIHQLLRAFLSQLVRSLSFGVVDASQIRIMF